MVEGQILFARNLTAAQSSLSVLLSHLMILIECVGLILRKLSEMETNRKRVIRRSASQRMTKTSSFPEKWENCWLPVAGTSPRAFLSFLSSLLTSDFSRALISESQSSLLMIFCFFSQLRFERGASLANELKRIKSYPDKCLFIRGTARPSNENESLLMKQFSRSRRKGDSISCKYHSKSVISQERSRAGITSQTVRIKSNLDFSSPIIREE